MATATLHRFIQQQQGTTVPPFPEWRIKRILFSQCKGARFVGIQKGLNYSDSLVLFNPPGKGPQSTLAVPLCVFSYDSFLATILVQHKIAFHELRMAAAAAGVRL